MFTFRRSVHSSSPRWHHLSGAIAALCLTLGLGSCVQEAESVVVIGMPLLGEDEEKPCQLKSGGDLYLQAINVDLSFTTGLTIPVELQNNLLSVAKQSSNSGLDNSEMRMSSVDVDIRSPQSPAIEESVRAVNPQFLKFNLPLASNSFSGGGSRALLMVQIPEDTMSKYRDAMVANGFTDGTPVNIEVELRFHFDLTGGGGKVASRSFRAPVRLSMGGLRKCLPTAWKSSETPAGGQAKTYELCTPKNCASSRPTARNVCGNAQILPQHPRCCDGPQAWSEIPNALEICEVPR